MTANDQLPWKRRDHALFVCFAPVRQPRYALAQVVEHGGGGSAVAAPIARDILLYALCGGLPPLTAYPAEQRAAIEEQRAAMPRAVEAADDGEGPGMIVCPDAGPRGLGCFSRSTGRWCCCWCAVCGIGFLMLYSVAGGSTEPWAAPQMPAVRRRHGGDVRDRDGRHPVLAGMLSPLAYVGSFALLVLVEVMGEIGMGAQRWIDLGFFQLQPSELMKVALCDGAGGLLPLARSGEGCRGRCGFCHPWC